MKEKVEDASLLVLQRLDEYRQEVRLAIEAVSNAPFKLLSTDEVCAAMGISPKTLHRYVRVFDIPVYKIGKKNFYFQAEIKNCIVTRLRFWKQ